MLRSTILVVCLAISAGRTVASTCDHADDCNEENAILVSVKCASDGTCTCDDGGVSTEQCANTNIDTLVGSLNYDIKHADCAQLCTDATFTNGEKKCAYYRYRIEAGPNAPKICYLMSDAQCDGYSTHPCRVQCSDNDPDAHCCSNGIDCNNGVPPKPVPQPEACEFDAAMEYDDTGESLHWICGGVDPYAQKKVDENTLCEAHHSCSQYGYPAGDSPTDFVLQVKCAEDSDSPGPGKQYKWISNRASDEKLEDIVPSILTDGKLIEPPCKTPELVLSEDQFKEPGLSIFCSDTDVTPDFKITAPNTCILLCDYYELFTFFPGFSTDDPNVRGWLYSEDGATAQDLDSTNICCFQCQ